MGIYSRKRKISYEDFRDVLVKMFEIFQKELSEDPHSHLPYLFQNEELDEKFIRRESLIIFSAAIYIAILKTFSESELKNIIPQFTVITNEFLKDHISQNESAHSLIGVYLNEWNTAIQRSETHDDDSTLNNPLYRVGKIAAQRIRGNAEVPITDVVYLSDYFKLVSVNYKKLFEKYNIS